MLVAQISQVYSTSWDIILGIGGAKEEEFVEFGATKI